MKWLQRFAALLAAAVATTLLASVLQTQFNLARLAALGAPVAPGERLQATALDLVGFAPVLGVLTLAAFLVALPVTGLLRRWIVPRRAALYALGGAVALAAMLLLMEAALGIVAIAAARNAGGFAALAACGALGGWLFAQLTRPRS